MKNLFFLGVAVCVPLAILGWILYAYGKFFVSLFMGWRLGRELDTIQAESESRREKRKQEAAARLENGCEHAFDSAFGFPDGVCPKCGLAKTRPTGPCDHVWRRVPGPSPAAQCENCGKQYKPS